MHINAKTSFIIETTFAELMEKRGLSAEAIGSWIGNGFAWVDCDRLLVDISKLGRDEWAMEAIALKLDVYRAAERIAQEALTLMENDADRYFNGRPASDNCIWSLDSVSSILRTQAADACIEASHLAARLADLQARYAVDDGSGT